MTELLDIMPADLGLPDKFQSWRPGQVRAIAAGMDSPKRFVAQAVPTGGGKSLNYVALALLLGLRAVILTSTKGLQDQLMRDFEECGLVDIRGRNNYDCCLGQGYTCDEGRHARCPKVVAPSCPYNEAKMIAGASNLVVTNYSYWMLQNRYSEGLGKFDLLVCDEAHNAPDEVCEAMAVTVTTREVYGMLRSEWPQRRENMEQWNKWANRVLPRVQDALDDVRETVRVTGNPSKKLVEEISQWKNLESKLETLVGAEGPWCAAEVKQGFRFDPLWPSQYAERILFAGIPRVFLTSATIRPKTLGLLGVAPGDYDFQEYPSGFPRRNSPVLYIPTIKVDHRWIPTHQRVWLQKMDNIIRDRLDRKGVIHTVSYKRRDYLLEHSEFREFMITHDSHNTADMVRAFRAAPAPLILVSPSMSTGWDFPYRDCEYQIIAKVPFPDTRALILQMREKEDNLYTPYLMVQALVQACGRSTRAADDRCENFIVDDHIRWVIAAFHDLFPKWFLDRYMRSIRIPPAPEPLAVADKGTRPGEMTPGLVLTH